MQGGRYPHLDRARDTEVVPPGPWTPLYHPEPAAPSLAPRALCFPAIGWQEGRAGRIGRHPDSDGWLPADWTSAGRVSASWLSLAKAGPGRIGSGLVDELEAGLRIKLSMLSTSL